MQGEPKSTLLQDVEKIMLVDARQIKAARSLLRWKQEQLAERAGLGLSTIRRLERSESGIEANFDTVEKIRQTFESAGIEFIGPPHLGVRFWNGKADVGVRREVREIIDRVYERN